MIEKFDSYLSALDHTFSYFDKVLSTKRYLDLIFDTLLSFFLSKFHLSPLITRPKSTKNPTHSRTPPHTNLIFLTQTPFATKMIAPYHFF